MMGLLEKNKKQIDRLCKQHSVEALYAFGSILDKDFSEDSDIDLVIQFQDVDLASYFDNYMALKEKLESLFKRQVDLVENQAIRNPVFRRVVDREKRIIYERKDC